MMRRPVLATRITAAVRVAARITATVRVAARITATVGVAAVALAAGGALVGCAAPTPATFWTAAPAPSWSESPSDGPPPTRVRIPAIGVDAPLEALTLDDAGQLAAPVRYPDAGWYAAGTLPGDVGPAVIAGHVDSTSGPAVFYRLGQLRPGDLVEVERGPDWVRFRVVAVERYPKERFPTDRVYGPTPDPQLRLITCSGRFDATRHSYLDNTVVYAVGA
jgi:LPXTG-site transpeptidase (sortase) family protein